MSPEEASELRRVVVEAVREALQGSPETVDVEEAARLLHTSTRAIYVRHARGQMPKRLPGTRRLVWRKKDLLR